MEKCSTFACYACGKTVPDTGDGWPDGWALCIDFRAGCPACVAAGRAVLIGQSAAATDERVAV
jgi:hypothetical protein